MCVRSPSEELVCSVCVAGSILVFCHPRNLEDSNKTDLKLHNNSWIATAIYSETEN